MLDSAIWDEDPKVWLRGMTFKGQRCFRWDPMPSFVRVWRHVVKIHASSID